MKKLLAVFVLMMGLDAPAVFAQNLNLAELELLNEFLGNEPLQILHNGTDPGAESYRSEELLSVEKQIAEVFYKELMSIQLYDLPEYSHTWAQAGRFITERQNTILNLKNLIEMINANFIQQQTSSVRVETESNNKFSKLLGKAALAAYILPDEYFFELRAEVKSAFRGIREKPDSTTFKDQFTTLSKALGNLKEVYETHPMILKPKTLTKLSLLKGSVQKLLLELLTQTVSRFNLSAEDNIRLLQDFGEGQHGFLKLAREIEYMFGYQDNALYQRGYQVTSEPIWEEIRTQLNVVAQIYENAAPPTRVKFHPFRMKGAQLASARYHEMAKKSLDPGNKDPAESLRYRLIRTIAILKL